MHVHACGGLATSMRALSRREWQGQTLRPSRHMHAWLPALTRLTCGTGASVAPRLLLACEVQQPCSSQPAPRWPPRGSAAAHAEGSPGPQRPSNVCRLT